MVDTEIGRDQLRHGNGPTRPRRSTPGFRLPGKHAATVARQTVAGGAVNVYAPVKYQMFASVFLEQGARFPDRLAYHEHLFDMYCLVGRQGSKPEPMG